VTRYLADASIWSWANKGSRPDIAAKLAERVRRGQVATCVPVALEVLHRASSSGAYAQLHDRVLAPLDWLDLTDRDAWRALDVQRSLAAQSDGAHRRPAADFLIAAIAERYDDVVLWAFDNECRVIAALTGQRIELEVSAGPGQ
jgi:predicted nucleic acid-binding protein